MIWNHGLWASAYAISKFRGEMEVWRGIHEGLNAVIVNPSVIVGPGIWMGPGKQLFLSVFRGLKYYPSGSSGYIDVRDVAQTMILLSESNLSGERYILSAENITHRKYINLLADAMGRSRPRFLITPLLTKIAATITGIPPRINLKTLEIASEKLEYSNTKICDAFGMSFTPIKESVNLSVQLFINELNSVNK
jgi:dihydroflavonol-4-reductase